MGHYTTDSEQKELLKLAQTVNGNILEIGCNNGQTTKKLAEANPLKTIHAIDYPDAEMSERQKGEIPSIIGEHAIGLKNVIIEEIDSSDFDYKGKNIKLVFIDGGHNFIQVAKDSLKAFDNMKNQEGKIIIAWHDYLNNEWVKVKTFVDAFLSDLNQLGYKFTEGNHLKLKYIILIK